MSELSPCLKEENKNLFPFHAIVGQEYLKKALEIILVNPQVGSLLISGAKGTAKTTIVRGVKAFLENQEVIEIPLNATEEMLFGGLDMEEAIRSGQRNFSEGLLGRANGHYIYIDEINLFPTHLLSQILSIQSQKEIYIEREGFSYRCPLHYAVIGTMNPEEGVLSPAVLDRFGLSVESTEVKEIEQRVEIVKRTLAYEQDQQTFSQHYFADKMQTLEEIKRARLLLNHMEVSEGMMQLSAIHAIKAYSAGHRGELYLIEAAKAIGALNDRDYLLPSDIEEAAFFTLMHRRRSVPQENQQSSNEFETEFETPSENRESFDSNMKNGPSSTEDSSHAEGTPSSIQQDDEQEKEKPKESPAQPPEDQVHGIESMFSFQRMEIKSPLDRKKRKGSGKRVRTRTDQKQGRYVASTDHLLEKRDLAFDATFRAAAIYQKERKKSGSSNSLIIYPQDFRHKLREKRIGTNFLFVVDASGSMGVKERMKAVKGAVFQMLQEAYQKRDRVGIIAFRREQAEILLPITRSIDLAQKSLKRMPTGGKTPLAEGLIKAFALLKETERKENEQETVLILITDGRANSTITTVENPIENAKKIAKKIAKLPIYSVVIDTEKDFVKVGIAKEIATLLHASYYHLDQLSDGAILKIARQIP